MNTRINRLRQLASRRSAVNKQEDSGFGQTLHDSTRLVNVDGSFNVERIGNTWQPLSIYQWLVSISWRKFVPVVVIYYLFNNLFFALLYYLLGVENLKGIVLSESAWENFWHCFFFSIQTYTTIGYGAISPDSWSANVVVAIEALVGVLTSALITGLLYGRFAQPTIRLAYSENILIAPTKEGANGLLCRLVNRRSNRLVELEAQMIFSFMDTDKRVFVNLPLQVSKLQYFPLSWTLHHSITPESPLFELQEQDFRNINAEFMIMIKAFDDTFMQTLYTNTSYTWQQLVVGAKFQPMFYPDPNRRKIILDYNLLHNFVSAPLNDTSASLSDDTSLVVERRQNDAPTGR